MPILPLKSNIPTKSFPVSTILIIAANIAVFIYQLTLKEAADRQLISHLGAIPSEITHARHLFSRPGFPYPLTLFTSMFLHGGLLHVLGNMLYLWIFGHNVEDNLGHIKFIIFFLLCGLAAAGTHIYINQDSLIPMIGASGAVSGVLGAYILLYPQAKILTFFFFRFIEIPAVALLGLWIIFQLISGTSMDSANAGVAWFAHVGGFLAGMILLNILLRRPGKRYAN